MSRSRPPAPRGFTLLELVVGLVVALLVFSAVTEAMVQVDNFRRLTIARGELDRDLQTAVSWLRRDIAATGLGRAVGSRMANGDTVGSTNSAALVPAIMSGTGATRTDPTTTQFLVFADVPRPDTNFDGFSLISGEDLGTDFTKLPVLNELNGRLHTTSTPTTSNPRIGALDPLAVCSSANNKGCPYGYRKYSAASGNEWVQVVGPDGNWQNAVLNGFSPATTGLVGTPPTLNFSTAPTFAPNSPLPAGRVLQIDRIGYRINSSVSPARLERRQCWGKPVPDTAADFTNCGATNDTDWEPIARNVNTAASSFIYLAQDGVTTTTTPANIQMLQLRLELSRTVKVGGSTRRLQSRVLERMMFPRL